MYHLGHLVPAHALLPHPLEHRGLGPVAAQAYLEEAVTAGGAGFDQPPHRRAVAVEQAEVVLARVGVGIEVDDPDPAESHHIGETADVGVGDGVVASEDQRECTRVLHVPHGLTEPPDAQLDIAGHHPGVAGIDDAQFGERIDAQGEAGPVRDVRDVVGGPDGVGAEAGAGAVGRAAIEGSADDDHIGAGIRARIAERRPVAADKADVRSELGRSWPAGKGLLIGARALGVRHFAIFGATSRW